MSKIYPVLLAGGSGTRLWPLSRKSYPKQFSNLLGDKTLFQQSALRLKTSKTLQFADNLTVTNTEFRFIVVEQLQNIGIDPGKVIIEPQAKNTAPAILAASILAMREDPEAALLVAPSDHLIPNTEYFHKIIIEGLTYLKQGKMVTLGIRPTYPETGYGYLQLDDPKSHATNVLSFVEKPNIEKAKKMLKTGNYLWNAGIFLFRAKDMLLAFEKYKAKALEYVSRSVDLAQNDLGFLRLEGSNWANLEAISIDYAIMERVGNLIAIPFDSKWSDLGGWDAVWSETSKDENGNATSDGAFAIECTNTLLRSENTTQKIVGLGLNEIIAISMSDAVLVAHKEMAQDVKKVVKHLKLNNVSQAEIFPKDHRPWGWFESLVLSERFQVKRICVKPSAALSLQSHHHRSEHWIVVSGTAKVTVQDEVKLLQEGQSVYVPLGAVHRMENPGKVPMIMIEVQIGSYLGEDDIVRYEDIYARD